MSSRLIPGEFLLKTPVARSALGVTGALTTLILVAVPAISWAPAGLIGIGVFAAASGFLLLSGLTGSRIQRPQAVAGIFMVVYGASCLGGGFSGHGDPLMPLLHEQSPQDAGGELWTRTSSADQAQVFIDAAVAATQKALIFWGDVECEPCTRAMALGVLNPSINPKLAGYRLIQVKGRGPAIEVLRERYGASGQPALTLLGGNGEVPDYGHLNKTVDAAAVMRLLELDEQAEAAMR